MDMQRRCSACLFSSIPFFSGLARDASFDVSCYYGRTATGVLFPCPQDLQLGGGVEPVVLRPPVQQVARAPLRRTYDIDCSAGDHVVPAPVEDGSGAGPGVCRVGPHPAQVRPRRVWPKEVTISPCCCSCSSVIPAQSIMVAVRPSISRTGETSRAHSGAAQASMAK